MDPATLALISASIAEATRLAFKLADLVRRGNAGELDDAAVLEEWRKAVASYDSARNAWDEADAPPPTVKGK